MVDTENGATLWEAASRGKRAHVERILQRCANGSRRSILEYHHPTHGTTPLLAAAVNNHPGIVEVLAQSGARVNAAVRTTKRSTALHIAAFYGFETVARSLIANGADVYRLDAQGLLPLDVARMKASESCVHVLMETMEVYQAKLAYRNANKMLKAWKRGLACMLRVSGDNKPPLYELAFYPTKDSICPTKVAWFNPESTRLIKSDSHAHEMVFDPPAIWRQFKPSTFSRDTTKIKSSPRPFRLLAESHKAMEEWLAVGALITNQSRVRPRSRTAPGSDVFVPLAQAPNAMANFVAPQPPPPARYSLGSQDVGDAMSKLSIKVKDIPPPLQYHPPVDDPPTYTTALRRSSLFRPSAPPLDDSTYLTPPPRSPPPAYSSVAVAPPVESAESRLECKICFDKQRDALCLPCAHLQFCYDCLQTVYLHGDKLCPICRTPMSAPLRVHL